MCPIVGRLYRGIELNLLLAFRAFHSGLPAS